MSHRSALGVVPLVVLLSVLGLARPAFSQPPPAPTTFEALRDGPASAALTATEWVTTLEGPAAPGVVADLPAASHRLLAEAKVRERDPRLSSDSLVVTAVDQDGRTLDWQIVADPRTVRAETPGPGGLLTGQVLAYARAELRVALNAGAAARQIRVYKPRWDGTEWLLEPVAVATAAR